MCATSKWRVSIFAAACHFSPSTKHCRRETKLVCCRQNCCHWKLWGAQRVNELRTCRQRVVCLHLRPLYSNETLGADIHIIIGLFFFSVHVNSALEGCHQLKFRLHWRWLLVETELASGLRSDSKKVFRDLLYGSASIRRVSCTMALTSFTPICCSDTAGRPTSGHKAKDINTQHDAGHLNRLQRLHTRWEVGHVQYNCRVHDAAKDTFQHGG